MVDKQSSRSNHNPNNTMKKTQTFVGRLVPRTQKGLVILFVVLMLFATLPAIYSAIGGLSQKDTVEVNNEYIDFKQELLGKDDSEESRSKVVKEYGGQYDQKVVTVLSKKPSDWTQEDLDDAYMALLYANKIKAYTQVAEILSMIEVAKMTGLNIDNNIYGIDQGIRDSIKTQAEAKISTSVDEVREAPGS